MKYNEPEKLKVWDKKYEVWMELGGKTDVRASEDGYEMSTGWDGLDRPTFGRQDDEGYDKMTKEEYNDYQNRFSYYIRVQ